MVSGLELFGFQFKDKGRPAKDLPSFVPEPREDGAVQVAAGGAYGTAVDLDGTVRTEAELVTKYREMSMHPECDSAIDEITNEVLAIDERELVRINLDECPISPQIKGVVENTFKECLRFIDFNNQAYEIFKRWYIDGRLYYHVIIDTKNPSEGIQEIRYIDPRKIRKVREIKRTRPKVMTQTLSTDVEVTKTVNEYFVYNDKGFGGNIARLSSLGSSAGASGLKIAKDSVIHVTSGLMDSGSTMVLSYLHPAIKALNQLRILEDATVIYRLARAPERRVWYIDVGNLPKIKAEQYVRELMVKHKNKLVYDATTGQIQDARKFTTMLEDFWLPRREGGKGTEVSQLAGGQSLGQLDDVLYFQKKFLNSLHVPVSRLNSDALFSIGRATEISRDELKFSKFISRLRAKFANLFLQLIEKQLILKGLMTLEEWKEISYSIKFEYARDNYFTELKNAEMLTNRAQLAMNMQPLIGKYYSHEWLRKNVLLQSEDEIAEEDQQIAVERDAEDPRWFNPYVEQSIDTMMNQDGMSGGEVQDVDPNNLITQKKDQDGKVVGAVGASQANNIVNKQRQKMQVVQQALVDVRRFKKKPKDERTSQEQTKYKSAVQLVAKNPDIVSKLGLVNPGKNTSKD